MSGSCILSRSSQWRVAAAAAAIALVAARGEELRLETLGGEAVSIAPVSEHQAVVVHFWATWCPSCVEELGLLDAAVRRCPPERARIVAVNVGDDVAEILEHLEHNALQLEVLRDPSGDVWRELTGQGLPANLEWARDERIVSVGPRSAAQWKARLSQLGCDE